MVSARTTLHFLSPYSGKESVKAKEIRKSEQLAHCAKFQHRRRQRPQKTSKKPGRAFVMVGLLDTPRSLPLNAGSSKNETRTVDQNTVPPPSLFRGSSDPFDSFVVSLSPEVNSIITFAKDVHLPAIFCPRWTRRKQTTELPRAADFQRLRVFGSTGWSKNIAFAFSSPEATLAWICGHTRAYTRLLPPVEQARFERLSLAIKSEAVRNLRKNVSKEMGRKRASVSLMYQIFCLFRAELVEGRPCEASVHARIMQQTAEATEDVELNVGLFTMGIYNDTEFACKTWTKPMLDYDKWVPDKMAPTWAYLESQLPQISPDVLTSNSAVTDKRLSTALTNLKKCFAISDGQDRMDDKLRNNLFMWWSAKSFHDIGILITHAVLLLEKPPVGKQWMEAAMTIATLQNVKKYLHEASYSDVDFRDTSHVILPKLRFALEGMAGSVKGDEDFISEEAVLWMLFTGAHWEQSTTSIDPWFTRGLARKARQLNLEAWENARPVLESFFFNDSMYPHPFLWYDYNVQGLATL